MDELDAEIKAMDVEIKAMEAEEIARMAEEAAALVDEAALRRYKGLQLRSVEVEENELVTGSIVAVGPVTVGGTVEGDVISYKRITVTSTGIIEGDARAPEIIKMRGGVIMGERDENELPRLEIPEFVIFDESSYTVFWVNLIIFISLLILGLIAVAIVPRPIDRIKVCLETGGIKAFFVGFAGWFALGPVFGILCLTIIGIPVAVFVLPVGLIVGILLGIVGAGQLVGQLADKYFPGTFNSQVKRIIIGLTVTYAFWLIMALFMAFPRGVTGGISTLFLVLAIIIWSIIVTAGLGAVVLTRFGSRQCRRFQEEAVHVSVEVGEVKPPPPIKGDDNMDQNTQK
jgi:hypothetical protein